jgi:Tfp pilus assembly protein PilO
MLASPRERTWVLGTAVAALLLVLIGYFAFISPEHSKAQDVQSQVADAQTQNVTLSARVTSLAMQSKKLATYKADLAKARLALPSTSGMTDFLRTLQSIGNATHADSSLTVGTPTDVTSLSGATPSSGSTNLSVGSAHIYALPITAQVSGTVAQLNAFLTQLQSVQPRAVLISEITETSPATGASGATTLQLTMQAFVAPSSAAEDQQLSEEAHD